MYVSPKEEEGRDALSPPTPFPLPLPLPLPRSTTSGQEKNQHHRKEGKWENSTTPKMEEDRKTAPLLR